MCSWLDLSAIEQRIASMQLVVPSFEYRGEQPPSTFLFRKQTDFRHRTLIVASSRISVAVSTYSVLKVDPIRASGVKNNLNRLI
jgi:hypothetical protein